MVERSSIARLAQRLFLAVALSKIAFTGLETMVTDLRPEIIADRPQDLTYLFREIRPNYDFIVIGAGSTGCVVARRLCEVKDWNVLLLEAGGEETITSDIPLAFRTLQNAPVSWERLAEFNPNYCQAYKDHRCRVNTGRVLGGTSTTNGMSYSRGNRRDYDHWAYHGNTGWDYHSVLAYFKKSEDMRIPELMEDDKYHSSGGCLSIEEIRSKTKVSDIFLNAGREMGYDIIDHNGHTQHGFAMMYSTLRNGLRCNTATAFLRPVKDHKNLDISLNSEVQRILIDPHTKQAKGVVFVKKGREYTVYANKEVILSAGAIHSPKLLMLSGVGPKEHLQEMGISPIISDLPVGHNLQDHIAIGGIAYLIKPGLGSVLHTDIKLTAYIDFAAHRQTPVMRTGFEETVGYVNSEHNAYEEWPDIGLYLSSIPENTEGNNGHELNLEYYQAVYEPILYRDAFESLGVLLRPRSRGFVKLKGKDPNLPPAIYPNYMSDPHDLKILVEAAKYGMAISKTRTMQNAGATLNPNLIPACADFPPMSEPYLMCAAKQETRSLCHYVGTCKMGPKHDPQAVVDPRLRVYGVKFLRVADASIIPYIPSGDINAAAIMIGEKIADMIKEDWVLVKKKKNNNKKKYESDELSRSSENPTPTIVVLWKE